MIRLTKTACPAVLTQNAAAWTAVIVQKTAAGQEPTAADKSHYRHVDIKEALVAETYGKCAYCESKLRHITYGDVEHIIPKKLDPKLYYMWANLTLACDICNTNKGVREDIIDPYTEEPNDHLLFSGPSLFPHPESDLGFVSENTLELNRAELLERRIERLRKILMLVKSSKNTSTPAVKAIIEQDLVSNECADGAEYAGCVRALLRQLGII
ncbi:MAG TPA: HNH endonuclease [Gammaproteobacteria bacterium]|jgi:5-methylcytosine-specific restriction endonuclease McrA